MDKRVTILNLKNILNRGVMSPKLKESVEASIKALEDDDLYLAYQLTACKSLIVGRIDPGDTRNAFQEDQEANEKAFNESIYNILGGIHHEIAMSVQKLPSGMSIHSAAGTIQMTHEGVHPVVQRIISEHDNIRREVEEIHKKRN